MVESSSSIFELQGVINVYGPNGCGKSSWVKSIGVHIELDHDHLRTKESASDLFARLACNRRYPVILDDYECIETLPGVKELRRLAVQFYIISIHPIVSLDIIDHYVKCIPRQEILPDAEQRDIFLDPTQYITELINTSSPLRFIDRLISEHGNTFGIMHENYIDYHSNLAKITSSFSDADLVDVHIYKETAWDLMHVFNLTACIIPAFYVEGPTRAILRPGSLWTKTNNMLMKASRLRKLHIPLDHIQLLASKANAKLDIPVYTRYDLDTINQLAFTKIKPKILQGLKKKCQKQAE